MNKFWSILFGSAAALAVIGGARSADLPTKKAPAAAPSTASCFASFYDYMSASARDCPLSYLGITVYGQVDVGRAGAPMPPASIQSIAPALIQWSPRPAMDRRFNGFPMV
jgi:hypothetical protein